jgi:hypothetical protein
MSHAELSKEKFTALMREAQQAHYDYETKLGHPDADWPAWYAPSSWTSWKASPSRACAPRFGLTSLLHTCNHQAPATARLPPSRPFALTGLRAGARMATSVWFRHARVALSRMSDKEESCPRFLLFRPPNPHR